MNLMTENILNINNYHLSYGEQKVLNNVNLGIKKNKVTALIGPSGCGKSSLLLSISNLLSSHRQIKQVGDINYKNKNIIEQKTFGNFRRQIGLVFQKPQPFPMSVKQNILLPIQEHFNLNTQEQKLLVEEVLLLVGLWDEVKDRLNQSALSLSGGQQQRLCLARSLVLKPEILLMDEPCSSLDPLSTEIIENLVVKLKSDCSILLVTHNLAQARRVSDETAVLWAHQFGGELIESGPTEKIFSEPKNEATKLYLSRNRG